MACGAGDTVVSTMDSPLGLSVVVPTHDTRELTLRCLAALAAAEPPPEEVTVVDDGSADGTAEAIAASYPAVRLLRHATALGFTAAANAGLAAAAGPCLLLLNSDTEVSPGALGALGGALAAHPRLGVAGGSLVYPDGTPQWSGGGAPDVAWLFALASGLASGLGGFGVGSLRPWRRLRPVSGHAAGSDRPGSVVEVAWVTGAALAIRRAAWEQVGPLDGRFALYCQDVDLCLRAGDLGWGVAVVPSARVMHHQGASISGGGAAGPAGHDTAALWSDLARLAGKRGGAAAARRAARALRLGGWVRRQLLLPSTLGGGERRRRARLQRRALAAAAAEVRALDQPFTRRPAGAGG
jgi:GT2 family glycosyltransferase